MNSNIKLNHCLTLIQSSVAAIAVLMLSVASVVPVFAQEAEIEIVNQDGEPVEGARLLVKPGAEEAEAVDAGEIALDDGNQSNKFLLKSENGKITFTDNEGNEQTIDLEGAQSVVVQQSAQSVNNNGQQQTKMVGKAIVVDADGKRHEIDLGDQGAEGLNMPAMPGGFPNMFSVQRNVNKYMIGVHCAKVAPALQAQLGLAEGSGLLVAAVGDGSPASAAGLQKHDILLFADDQELLTQQDLVRVVQKAGEADSSLSLTVMRSGEEIGVDVAPVERTAEQMRVGFPREMNGFDFDFGPLGNGFGNMEFKQFGPGIILGGGGLGGDFEDRMENMRQQMQEVQQQMQEMQQRMRNRFDAGE